jgi:hypothetical protein
VTWSTGQPLAVIWLSSDPTSLFEQLKDTKGFHGLIPSLTSNEIGARYDQDNIADARKSLCPNDQRYNQRNSSIIPIHTYLSNGWPQNTDIPTATDALHQWGFTCVINKPQNKGPTMSFTCRSANPPPASRFYLNTSTITFNPIGRSPTPLTLTPAGQLIIPTPNSNSIPTDINTQLKTLVDQAVDQALTKHNVEIDEKLTKIQTSTDQKLQTITNKIEKNNTKLTTDIAKLNESHNSLKTSIEAKLDSHSDNFQQIIAALSKLENKKEEKENTSPVRKQGNHGQGSKLTPNNMQA